MKNGQTGLLGTETLCSAKDPDKGIKRQATDWPGKLGGTSACRPAGKELVSGI